LCPVYRAKQFFLALNARVEPEQLASLNRYLNPAQLQLFAQLPPADQRHALAVLRTLESQGHTDSDLLQAALLHDLGKGEGIGLLYRVAIVLLRAFAPHLLDRLAEGVNSGWRRPFAIYKRHAARGAELAAEAGSTDTVVWLIRHHEDVPNATTERHRAELLTQLRAADGEN
jgi:hypothetical protein